MAEQNVVIRSAKEMLAAMGCPQYITFEESMKALRMAGDSTGNVWPKLSGNEIHVFANAAIHLHKTKSHTEKCTKCHGLGYYDEGHENDDGTMSGGNYVNCEFCEGENNDSSIR